MSKHSEVLYILRIVLIEVRAAENLKKAQVLADVVHNIPMMISNNIEQDEIVAKVMQKAKRQGVEDYFSGLFDMAKNR